jgi:hypothetical protein
VKQSGQLTIEAILILTVIVAIMLTVYNKAHNDGWMKALVEGPWKPLQGMIEDGVWEKAGTSMADNPSLKKRHGTNKGNQPGDAE